MDKPAEQVPQVWVLFTEVYKYYDAGLKLPDDVTLMFADDNVGNLRRLPTPRSAADRGGFGIYFHMDMHGGPFSYQWINSNPLPKIWEQMNLAQRIWRQRDLDRQCRRPQAARTADRILPRDGVESA